MLARARDVFFPREERKTFRLSRRHPSPRLSFRSRAKTPYGRVLTVAFSARTSSSLFARFFCCFFFSLFAADRYPCVSCSVGSLPRGAFTSLGGSLLRLDLSNNELSHMEDGALSGVQHLLLLNISRNSLNRFNSDVFRGKLFARLSDVSTYFE